jgi:hypothetical protein
MGIDRIAMLKYGMPDLRAFFDADVRWLKHYGFRPLDLPTQAVEDKAKERSRRSRCAHVISAEKHPNADKLKVCMVETGSGTPCRLSAARRMRAAA